MGCGSSGVQKPEYYIEVLQQEYDSRIIPITNPSKKQIEQLVDTLAQSFSGDKQHQPELTYNWIIGEEHQEFDSPLRKNLFKFYMKWILIYSLKYGVVYAMYDQNSGKYSGVACMYPPEAIKNGVLDTKCRFLNVARVTGLPPNIKDSKKYGKAIEIRCNQMEITQKKGHKEVASMPHWQALAVRQEFQGQKIGKAFLNLMSSFADIQNVPCYLECSGDRNIKIYEKFGYQAKKTFYNMEKNKLETKCLHPTSFMLRPPKKDI